MEEYEPSAMEVMREIWQHSKKISSGQLGRIGEAFTGFLIAPYVLPTVFAPSVQQNTQDLTRQEKIDLSFGMILAVPFLIAQAIGYSYAYEKGHSELLAIPLLTNLASLGHEEWKSAKRRVMENKDKTIDNVAEEGK